MPNVGHKRACTVTIQDWQDCVNYAYKKGLSKKTCKNIRGTITALCNYARRNNIPLITPVGGDTIIPKDAPAKEKSILQPNEIKKLFTESHITRYGKDEPCLFIPTWRFALLTSLRRSEQCGLEKANIDGRIIHIKETKTDAAGRHFVFLDLQFKCKPSPLGSPTPRLAVAKLLSKPPFLFVITKNLPIIVPPLVGQAFSVNLREWLTAYRYGNACLYFRASSLFCQRAAFALKHNPRKSALCLRRKFTG